MSSGSGSKSVALVVQLPATPPLHSKSIRFSSNPHGIATAINQFETTGKKIHFNDDTLAIEIQFLVLCNNNNKNCWKRKKKTDLKRNEREQRRDATATAERSGLTDVRDRSVYVCEYPTAPPLGQRIFFSLFLAVW